MYILEPKYVEVVKNRVQWRTVITLRAVLQFRISGDEETKHGVGHFKKKN